jgi:hypothetical protein
MQTLTAKGATAPEAHGAGIRGLGAEGAAVVVNYISGQKRAPIGWCAIVAEDGRAVAGQATSPRSRTSAGSPN